jgi:hypothetical protein
VNLLRSDGAGGRTVERWDYDVARDAFGCRERRVLQLRGPPAS